MTVHVSLICPVYKVAAYLSELMQSLLDGVNSEKVEVIFVDDCCPEQSIAVCEQFLNEHAELIKFQYKVIKQSVNQGQAAARNTALAVAKGEYIGFIDSDDAISPYYWETLSSYVVAAQYDIIEFTFEEFKDGLPVPIKTDTSELPSSNLNPFYYDFFVWTRLYKRKIVEGLAFPEGMIYEDIFYNIHAFSKAKNTVRLSNSLVYYRKREGSTTALRTSEYSQLLINLVDATHKTIDAFSEQRELLSLLQRKCFVLMLKGLKIVNKDDRKKYYQLCLPHLLFVKQLAKKYGTTTKSKVLYLMGCVICRAFT